MSDKFTFIGTQLPKNPTDLYDGQIDAFQRDNSHELMDFMKHGNKKTLDVSKLNAQTLSGDKTKSGSPIDAIAQKLSQVFISGHKRLSADMLTGFRKMAVVQSYNTAKVLQAHNIQIDKMDIMNENAYEYYQKSLDALDSIDQRMDVLVKTVERMQITSTPADHFGKTFDTSALEKILNNNQFTASKYLEFMNSSAITSQDLMMESLAKRISMYSKDPYSGVGQLSKAPIAKMMDTAKTAYNVAEKILPSRFTGIQTANPIISAILRQIGIETAIPLAGVKTLSMDIEAVPFDTITRKQIVEIIPGLLQKIHGALTGRTEGKELVYDIPRQQFIEKEVLAAEYGHLAKSAFNKGEHYDKFFDYSHITDEKQREEMRKKVNKRMSGINREDAFFSKSQLSPEDETDAEILRQMSDFQFAKKAKFYKRYMQNFAEMIDFDDRMQNATFFQGHRGALAQQGGINYGGLINPGALYAKFAPGKGEDVLGNIKDELDSNIAQQKGDRWAVMFREPTSEIFEKTKTKYAGVKQSYYERISKKAADAKADALAKMREQMESAKQMAQDQITNPLKDQPIFRRGKKIDITDTTLKFEKVTPTVKKVIDDTAETVTERIFKAKQSAEEKRNQFQEDIKERVNAAKEVADSLSKFTKEQLITPFMTTLMEQHIRLVDQTNEKIVMPLAEFGQVMGVAMSNFRKKSRKQVHKAKTEIVEFIQSDAFKVDIAEIRKLLGLGLENFVNKPTSAVGSLIQSIIGFGTDSAKRAILRGGKGDKLGIEPNSAEWKRLFKSEGERKKFFGTIKTYFFGPLIQTIKDSQANIVATVRDAILKPVLDVQVNLTKNALKIVNKQIGMVNSLVENTKQFITDSVDYFKQFGTGKAFEDNVVGVTIKKAGYIVRETINGVIDPFVKKTVQQLSDIQSFFIKTLADQITELNDKIVDGVKEIGSQFKKEFLEPATKRLIESFHWTMQSIFGGERGTPSRKGVIGDVIDKLAVLADYYREKTVDAIKNGTKYFLEKIKEGVSYAFDGFKKAVTFQLGKVYEGFNYLTKKDGPLQKILTTTLGPVFGMMNKFINRDKKGNMFERIADRLGDKIKSLGLQEKLEARKRAKLDRHLKVARMDNPLAAAALDAGKTTAKHTGDTVRLLKQLVRYQQGLNIGTDGNMIKAATDRGMNMAHTGEVIDRLKKGDNAGFVTRDLLNKDKNHSNRGTTYYDQLSNMKEMDAKKAEDYFKEQLVKNTGDTASGIGTITKGFQKIWMLFPLMLGFLKKVPLLGTAITALTALLAKKGGGVDDLIDGMDGPDGRDPKKGPRGPSRAGSRWTKIVNFFQGAGGAIARGGAKYGGMAVRAGGKLALPVTAAMAAYDGYQGVKDTDNIVGQDKNFLDKTNAGVQQALSGLTFGAVDPSTIAKSEYNPANWMSDKWEFAKKLVAPGLPEEYLKTTAMIESSGNPNAVNSKSGASGLFQFMPHIGPAYGVTDPFNIDQQIRGATKMAMENSNYLKNKLGRDPTGAEIYLAHQQGAKGAATLLSNPNANAAELLGSTKKVLQNGGNLNMTSKEFTDMLQQKYIKTANAMDKKYNPDTDAVKIPETNKSTELLNQVNRDISNSQKAGEVGDTDSLIVRNSSNIKDLNPAMLKNLMGAANEYYQATGRKLKINSGFRTIDEQARLYNSSRKDGMVARPGSQMHNYGFAIDADSAELNEMAQLGILKKHNLWRPVGNEPWHLELYGINRGQIRQAGLRTLRKGGSGDEAYSAGMAKSGYGGKTGVESEDPMYRGVGTNPLKNPNVTPRENTMGVYKADAAVPDVQVSDPVMGVENINRSDYANKLTTATMQVSNTGTVGLEQLNEQLKTIAENTGIIAKKEFTVQVDSGTAKKEVTQTQNNNFFNNTQNVNNNSVQKTPNSPAKDRALSIARGDM